MSNFYVGQKVVCVDDSPSEFGIPNIKKGLIYTIKSLFNHPHGLCINVIEAKSKSAAGFRAERFRPLLTDSIEFAETLLNEITIEINEENLITK